MGTPPKSASESDPEHPPPLDLQKKFWDEWNMTYRLGVPDRFMEREREIAISVAHDSRMQDARILDAGCGTGWLGNALLPFGRVWGTDLSSEAIAQGAVRHPGVQFVCGDFLEIDLPGPFDYVVGADSLANMRDQYKYVQRIAELLRPGGTFLLMTPNPAVWRRRSKVKTLAPGQCQVWPSLAQCREMLEPYFTVDRVASLEPGGDQGMLWWVENRYVRGGMERLLGNERWRSILERLGLGRQLVLVARRRESAPN